MTDTSRWFVSTDWLAAHLDDPNIAIVDASWHLPGTNRDGRKEYDESHIPGAAFFDIDAISDKTSPLPHMLPTPEAFAEAVGALGIDEAQKIVVYDGLGLFSAPRVWWTFRIMGARDVVILAGGLPKWKAEGRPLTDAQTARAPRSFRASPVAGQVHDLDSVRANIDSAAFQLVDARPGARFLGDAPEPRPGMRSGHVPGSVSLPASDLVANGMLKDAEALQAAIDKARIDLSKPLVTSCGSGVSAAIVTLALETLGKSSALYDGSWSEWGGRDDTPIATGPA